MRLFTIATFLLIFLPSCLYKRQEEITPVKAKGIPEKAFWVGGLDGGNWYLVDFIHPHKNGAQIRVYNDHDGSLIISKRFSLACPVDNLIWIENLEEQINSFDGEKIYLKPTNGKMSCYLH